jgi:hypothetical protein
MCCYYWEIFSRPPGNLRRAWTVTGLLARLGGLSAAVIHTAPIKAAGQHAPRRLLNSKRPERVSAWTANSNITEKFCTAPDHCAFSPEHPVTSSGLPVKHLVFVPTCGCFSRSCFLLNTPVDREAIAQLPSPHHHDLLDSHGAHTTVGAIAAQESLQYGGACDGRGR